ncbi:MAG TPA: HAD family hydrolase [Ignavibacteria bacterium]|nr:HAD family hydrolase [Ignavibacteria bacterium]
MNKAVFLDRDGTLNVEVDYLDKVEDLILIQNAEVALLNLKNSGFLNIIITNQSGIARGYFDLITLEKIHNELLKKLTVGSVTLIDDIYFSPYHSSGIIEEFKIEHEDRKPNTGMIVKAIKKHNINISESWLIGDSFTDMKCASNAGLKKILVLTGYGKKHLKMCEENNILPDFIAESILEASDYIINFKN